jgi:hypothetical protein
VAEAVCWRSHSVPAKLFWSITIYDAETRSEIATDQNKAALRSLYDSPTFPPTNR